MISFKDNLQVQQSLISIETVKANEPIGWEHNIGPNALALGIKPNAS